MEMAIEQRIRARQALILAHVEMLVEAEQRGEDVDLASQLSMLVDEMEFRAGMARVLLLGSIKRHVESVLPLAA